MHDIIEYVIDEKFRTITIPSNGLILGVVGDKEINQIRFTIPKYCSGFDLSDFTARVNYVNPNGDGNYWETAVQEYDEDHLSFVWLLEQIVTRYVGDVMISVKLFKRENGQILKQFNTRSATGKVYDGFDVSSTLTPEEQESLLDKVSNDIDLFKNEVKQDLEEMRTQLSNHIDTENTAIDQLKSDLVNGNIYDEDFYMFLSPFYLQSHLLEFGKKIGLSNGKYVIPSNGTLDVNNDYCVTDYLPIRTDTNYRTVISGGTAYYAFYDEDKSYLSGNNLFGVYYVTPPENAKYVRFSCPISAYDTNIFVQWKYQNSTTFNIGENVRVPYSQVTDAPMIETTVVNVSDYTNLRACLEGIQPTENHHYIVNIPNGTYDIKSMYTETEKNESGFRGLFVPNYTKIVGIGNKEDTIIRYDNSASEEISQNISTLHFRDWVEMENVTVIGTRIRYAVHDDFPTSGCDVNHRFIKNCDFKVYESYYNDCYGSGQKGGADWTFENCNFEVASVNADFSTPDFLRAFSNHASTNMINSSKFLFDNCNFKTINTSIASVRLTTMSNGSTALNYATFKGCRINGKITLTEENTDYGRGNLFKVNGYANNFNNADVTLSFTDGVDYSDYVDLH